jgi:hypothetical protein
VFALKVLDGGAGLLPKRAIFTQHRLRSRPIQAILQCRDRRTGMAGPEHGTACADSSFTRRWS